MNIRKKKFKSSFQNASNEIGLTRDDESESQENDENDEA